MAVGWREKPRGWPTFKQYCHNVAVQLIVPHKVHIVSSLTAGIILSLCIVAAHILPHAGGVAIMVGQKCC
ncbi:hypothetical protein CHUV2995_00784 [Corynebacterium diphtheriae subsp. lausannense]|nr:hypothetical protein BUE64_10220 [Corynebacterium diphtheriae subsp. lausannense]SPJ40000.1 hypothetical protein CHUV2995_00784 [Corynebacterium diphtheriae subsp. lausannense]